MRNHYIASALVLMLFFLVAGCKDQKKKTGGMASDHKVEYTCPMHPQIIRDQPGKCPICAMDLVEKGMGTSEMEGDTALASLLKPVNEQVVADVATVRPESGTRIFSLPAQGVVTYDTRNKVTISSRVSGRIERLYIRYNFQPVRKGELIMEIYSPDLAAAQRELLFIAESGGDASLLARARQRLSLLGMQEGQIRHVLQSRRILYRVPVFSTVSGYVLEQGSALSAPQASVGTGASAGSADGMGSMGGGAAEPAIAPSGGGVSSGSATSLLLREGQYVGAGQTVFSVYRDQNLVAEFALQPALAASVKRGQKLVFFKSNDPESVYTGSIGLIQPTYRAGSSFTLARVYTADSRLRVGQLVTARIPVLNRGWWLPSSAVVDLGGRQVVFRKDGRVFAPVEVKVSLSAEDLVLIETGVSGWEVARNAAYLVDSESFIRLRNSLSNQQPNN
ncbi:efflux RND transporter periplasmic adaptor subunit [Flaviaesturariibacter amylovorans]|uniref:Efflux RND transporter periplasmic adaptor subunit n=1 Tax=Flaviaesturariibacter amylovorans TaxID=1084520 RepID=A0ABP8HL29_9BACT